jgi:ABC-type nitrate/sulfonate/bicarbonate transport system substrate-binding protein
MRATRAKARLVCVTLCIGLTLSCNHGPVGPKTTGEPAQLSFRLKWFIYSSFAHHLVAQEKGLYRSENLKVDIKPGGANVDPIKTVAVGEDDVGLASYAQILLARQEGVPVVAIAEEYVKSGVVEFSLKKSGIARPQDFIGKRVGIIPGSDTGTVYGALMAKLGIDRSKITEVTIGFDLTPLLTGAIDVSSVGYISNQPVVVETQGYPVNIVDPHDYGVRPGGNVVFTTEENLRLKRDPLKRFLRAMIEGIELSRQLPDVEVVDLVLKYNPSLKRDSEMRVWEVTKDYLLSKDPGSTGVMPDDTWTQTADIFNRFGDLRQVPALKSCYTNELVNEILAERQNAKGAAS